MGTLLRATLALAAVCTLGLLPAHAATQPDPKAAAILVTDLPAGSTISGGDVSLAGMAKLVGASTTTLGQMGIVSGYIANLTTSPSSGILGGSEFVETFRDAAAASTALSLAVHAAAMSKKSAPVAASGLGTLAYIMESKATRSGKAIDDYMVIFVRGRLQVALNLSTLPNQAKGTARQIAGAIDTRLKRVTS
jgi:hypothetical protein